MRPDLIIQLDATREPFVEVPACWIWDLVEFLSMHRLHISYHFEQSAFRVTFHGVSLFHAQEVINDWTHSPVDVPEAHYHLAGV